jgi:hypothetical protein
MPNTDTSDASIIVTNVSPLANFPEYKSELYTDSLQNFKLNLLLSRTQKHWNTYYENTALDLIQMSSVILTRH